MLDGLGECRWAGSPQRRRRSPTWSRSWCPTAPRRSSGPSSSSTAAPSRPSERAVAPGCRTGVVSCVTTDDVEEWCTVLPQVVGVPRESRAGGAAGTRRPRRRSPGSRSSATRSWSRPGQGSSPATATPTTPPAGARVGGTDETWAADVLVTVGPRQGASWPGCAPAPSWSACSPPPAAPELVDRLCRAGVTARGRWTRCRRSPAPSRWTCCLDGQRRGYRAVVGGRARVRPHVHGQVTAAGRCRRPGLRRRCRCRGAGRHRRGVGHGRGGRAFDVRPRWPSRSSRWARRS